MSAPHPALIDLAKRDPRYAAEAYQFVLESLAHTQELLKGRRSAKRIGKNQEFHVSGKEMLDGIRDLARREFGLMARVVFHLWGIEQTDDFGEIIFNLVESRVLCTTENDRREDFHQVYDLDRDLLADYAFTTEPGEWAPVKGAR